MFTIFSAGYGMGHHRAADAVAKALNNLFPCEDVEVVDYLSLLPPRLAEATLGIHHALTRHWPRGYGAMYAVTGRLSTIPWWQRLEQRPGEARLAAWMKEHEPRAVVATHPMPLMGLAGLKQQGLLPQPVIGVITDYVAHPSWIRPGVDGYAVANEHIQTMVVQRLGAGIEARTTGIPIDPAFYHAPSGELVRSRWGWDQRPHVLVSLGSYGMPLSRALALIGALDELTPACVLVLLTGRDEAMHTGLSHESQNHPDWIVKPYQNNMAEWLAASDIVMTPAGALTLTEVAAVARPLVIYQPRPGQEQGNAQWFRDRGMAVLAFDPAQARRAVETLLTQRPMTQRMIQALTLAATADSAHQVALLVRDLVTKSRCEPPV
jgi:processive 1,2-diacylglycerol beta-glucosyltransferase